MFDTFKHHFAQTSEKLKPLEENIKEKEALSLAKEIKEIKERMKKEGERIEDYQRII